MAHTTQTTQLWIQMAQKCAHIFVLAPKNLVNNRSISIYHVPLFYHFGFLRGNGALDYSQTAPSESTKQMYCTLFIRLKTKSESRPLNCLVVKYVCRGRLATHASFARKNLTVHDIGITYRKTVAKRKLLCMK